MIMKPQQLQSELEQIISELSAGSTAKTTKITVLPKKPAKTPQKTAPQPLKDTLDFLRVSVKYLLFDLESTRRENSYLRKILEQSGR